PSGRSAQTAAPHAVPAAANAGGAAPACNPAPSVPSRDTSRSGFARVPGDSRSSSQEAPNFELGVSMKSATNARLCGSTLILWNIDHRRILSQIEEDMSFSSSLPLLVDPPS